MTVTKNGRVNYTKLLQGNCYLNYVYYEIVNFLNDTQNIQIVEKL